MQYMRICAIASGPKRNKSAKNALNGNCVKNGVKVMTLMTEGQEMRVVAHGIQLMRVMAEIYDTEKSMEL
jgi:hypothetical protein